MARDLFTISTGRGPAQSMCIVAASSVKYIQEYEIYIQECPNFLCPNIHWSGVAWKSVAFGLEYVSRGRARQLQSCGADRRIQVVYGCREQFVAKGRV